MHKQEYVLENGVQTIIYKFKMQTDHSIPTKIPDSVLMNNNKKIVF